MPESPTPEPTPAAKPAVPAPVPKAGRGRRLWRWGRKWTKRFVLLLLLLLLVTSAAYAIYRPLAFRASARELDAARAELDAAEPGWRYEDIEAAHNATIPPPDKNSFRLLSAFPKLKPLPPEQRIDTNSLHAILLMQEPDKFGLTNELPERDALRVADAFAEDLPITDPDVALLARSTVGGVAMHNDFRTYDLNWKPRHALMTAGQELEIASIACAARGDGKPTVVYAQASINAGRALGEMPRVIAQLGRRSGSTRATRMVSRLLAWGECDADTTAIQRDLLSEADTDWLKTAFTGERAAMQFFPPDRSVREEYAILVPWADAEGARSFSNRAGVWLARPYRDSCRAVALRDATRAIEVCDLPQHQRYTALQAIERRPTDYDALTGIRLLWTQTVTLPASRIAKSDSESRAKLRTTAVALACERFRQANGRWPDTLAEIPQTMLTAIPADPFDGKPLRYAKTEDSAYVYSVGPDGRERGEKPWEGGVSFRLWNPELRGLPPKPPFQPDPIDPP